jgi:hypothetical protein
MCSLFPALTALPELPAGTTVKINQTTDNPAVLTPQYRRQSAASLAESHRMTSIRRARSWCSGNHREACRASVVMSALEAVTSTWVPQLL